MDLDANSFKQACREGGRQIETWLRVVDREHGARFYREAAAALRSWQAAEDVVQEAMVKVWQRCATFRGPGEPLAWIHQIVRNTLLDTLRQRQAQAPREQPLHDDDGQLTRDAEAAVLSLSASGVATPEGWQPGEKVIVPPPKTAAAAAARAGEGYETTDWYFSKRAL